MKILVDAESASDQEEDSGSQTEEEESRDQKGEGRLDVVLALEDFDSRTDFLEESVRLSLENIRTRGSSILCGPQGIGKTLYVTASIAGKFRKSAITLVIGPDLACISMPYEGLMTGLQKRDRELLRPALITGETSPKEIKEALEESSLIFVTLGKAEHLIHQGGSRRFIQIFDEAPYFTANHMGLLLHEERKENIPTLFLSPCEHSMEGLRVELAIPIVRLRAKDHEPAPPEYNWCPPAAVADRIAEQAEKQRGKELTLIVAAGEKELEECSGALLRRKRKIEFRVAKTENELSDAKREADQDLSIEVLVIPEVFAKGFRFERRSVKILSTGNTMLLQRDHSQGLDVVLRKQQTLTGINQVGGRRKLGERGKGTYYVFSEAPKEYSCALEHYWNSDFLSLICTTQDDVLVALPERLKVPQEAVVRVRMAAGSDVVSCELKRGKLGPLQNLAFRRLGREPPMLGGEAAWQYLLATSIRDPKRLRAVAPEGIKTLRELEMATQNWLKTGRGNGTIRRGQRSISQETGSKTFEAYLSEKHPLDLLEYIATKDEQWDIYAVADRVLSAEGGLYPAAYIYVERLSGRKRSPPWIYPLTCRRTFIGTRTVEYYVPAIRPKIEVPSICPGHSVRRSKLYTELKGEWHCECEGPVESSLTIQDCRELKLNLAFNSYLKCNMEEPVKVKMTTGIFMSLDNASLLLNGRHNEFPAIRKLRTKALQEFLSLVIPFHRQREGRGECYKPDFFDRLEFLQSRLQTYILSQLNERKRFKGAAHTGGDDELFLGTEEGAQLIEILRSFHFEEGRQVACGNDSDGQMRLLIGVMCGTVYGMVASDLHENQLLFLSCNEQRRERRPKEVVKERSEPLLTHLGIDMNFRNLRLPRQCREVYAALSPGLTYEHLEVYDEHKKIEKKLKLGKITESQASAAKTRAGKLFLGCKHQDFLTEQFSRESSFGREIVSLIQSRGCLLSSAALRVEDEIGGNSPCVQERIRNAVAALKRAKETTINRLYGLAEDATLERQQDDLNRIVFEAKIQPEKLRSTLRPKRDISRVEQRIQPDKERFKPAIDCLYYLRSEQTRGCKEKRVYSQGGTLYSKPIS